MKLILNLLIFIFITGCYNSSNKENTVTFNEICDKNLNMEISKWRKFEPPESGNWEFNLKINESFSNIAKDKIEVWYRADFPEDNENPVRHTDAKLLIDCKNKTCCEEQSYVYGKNNDLLMKVIKYSLIECRNGCNGIDSILYSKLCKNN